MTESRDLETPGSPAELYLARGEEVSELTYRPFFTGDVVTLANGDTICLLQHPCAFRRGAELEDRLLVAEVAAASDVPADWSQGHFKAMFLPERTEDPVSHLKVNFSKIAIVAPSDLDAGERLCILSAFGVNLLLQRWIHHNSRVVVPTIRLETSTCGPFDEADLIYESVPDLVATGLAPEAALDWLEQWLSAPTQPGARPRREALTSRQSASSVRSSLRGTIAEL